LEAVWGGRESERRGVRSVRVESVMRDERGKTYEVSLLDDGEAGEGDDHDEEGKRVCRRGRQREKVSSSRGPLFLLDLIHNSQFATLMPSDKSFLFRLSLSSFARSS
jgi:hypothetical protein